MTGQVQARNAGISTNKRDERRPQYALIVLARTTRKEPLVFGNPHIRVVYRTHAIAWKDLFLISCTGKSEEMLCDAYAKLVLWES